ncbi:ATP-binding protein [Scatolibacter rhodanostii]|uniref:ATP-binding protein n=1 Tax=Scatolibacter rhodanostii TaxID=2014781 RepID=UPI000C08C3C6|nr:ATP-binding protein [Scatolibacter rhodanostii]
MGYGKQVYSKALTELESRRRDAMQKADAQVSYFFTLCPRAEEIRQKQASNGAKVAKAVLSGQSAKAALEKLKNENLALQAEFDKLAREHGFTNHQLNPQYSCTKCDDKGFIDGKMCSCLKNLQKAIAYERLNVNLPLENCSFSAFSLQYYQGESRQHMQRIFDYCTRYAAQFHENAPSLFFKGRTGLGKTHLALAIANEVIAKGYGVIYSAVQNFAVSLEKERFERGNDWETSDTNSQLLSCDLLIIDDLGTEFSSSYVNAALYNLINTRLIARKPTIISTNLSMKDLEDRYSERFASRIAGQYGRFEFVGNDIRLQKKEQRK